jgi:4-amino-4-deoxy-L-arabinose transferase-like glycosyltransferase
VQDALNKSEVELQKPSRSLTEVILLAGFCAFLFFFGLARFGLLGADEPRYAQVAREMLARHDVITPTLGGISWLEKPVLYYWQAMLAYRLFGVSDWAARLPSAFDATLMVFAIYLFLKRFRPGIALDGALMSASFAGVIGFARSASTDMPLAAAFTIAMLAWYAWHDSNRKTCLSLFYVFLALATLAKGPVAIFLAALILVLFAVSKRDFRQLWQTLWLPGILLFCVVTLPWYLAVQLRNPEFFRVFILEHNLARFGSNLYRHPQPFWYYLPVGLLGLVPWTVFFVIAIWRSARLWWAGKRDYVRSSGGFNVFLLIWLIAPVLFFSISGSKLPGYILPALPAGTLLASEYVWHRLAGQEKESLVIIVLHSILAALPINPAFLIQYIFIQRTLPWNSAAMFSTAISALLATAMVVTLRSRYGLRMLRFVTLVPVVLSIMALLKIGAPIVDDTLSARSVAQEVHRMQDRKLPLALFLVSRETEYGLDFYENQALGRYELNQIPSGEHLVIAPPGCLNGISKHAAGRRVAYLGGFTPQHLDFFWVSAKQ